jgi:hypothetical protein
MRKPVLLVPVCVLLAGIAGADVRPPIDPACSVLVPGTAGPPEVRFEGGNYFVDDANGGRPSLLTSTNPIGASGADFDELFSFADPHDRVVRIHLPNGIPFVPTFAGEAPCAWVRFWDDMIARAEARGLYVLPVFGVWDKWDSTIVPPVGQSAWDRNLYNSAALGAQCPDAASNACLTATPAGLLDATTPGGPGETWLNWMAALADRWKDRPNIVGWEVFSEVNKITGATDAAAFAFIDAAVARLRAVLPARPVTASLSGIDGCVPDLFGNQWNGLDGTQIDFVQVHVYAGFPPFSGDLDRMLVQRARGPCLTKPVFIGESGLDTAFANGDPAARPLIEPGARTGINHAVWAGAVSGAMNARSLWFEDGYDRYHYAKYDDGMGSPYDNLCDFPQFTAASECSDGYHTLRELYRDASEPVSGFVGGEDFTGVAPVKLTYGPTLFGAAVGNTQLVMGWVRDSASSAATGWAPTPLVTGATVTIDMPGDAADWEVHYHNTLDGLERPLDTRFVDQDVNGDVTLALPEFTGSIAFKIRPAPPQQVTIDVRPNDPDNSIRRNSRRWVAVAILSDPGFDATTVDVSSVTFGDARARRVADYDVDGLYGDDKIVRFRQRQIGLTCADDGQAIYLRGETTAGRSFEGSSVVTVRPCP